jgi:hypothetical protein
LGKKVLAILLGVLFIGGFGAEGVLVLVGVVRQALTASWPAAAEAIVVTSGASRQAGSHGGSTYAPQVAYRYRVGSTWYDSTTVYMGGEFSTSDGGYANAVIARFPSGSQTAAYVDPNNPGRSVLIKGLDNHQYVRVAFATPFLSFSLGALTIAAVHVTRRQGWIAHVRTFDPAPGICVARDCSLGPGVCAIGLAMLLGFVTPFPVIFGFENHPLPAMAVLGAGSIAVIAVVYVRQRRRMNEGRYDTVIDAPSGLLLPPRRSKPAVDPLPHATVSSVDLDERTQKRRRGSSSTSWTVVVCAGAGRAARSVDLVEFSTQPTAEKFRDWVTDRLAMAGTTTD